MLKALGIKILALVALIIGNIIRRKRRIDQAEIKTILINRTDRLGDALVSLPFLLELNKKFKITVLTSQYNNQALKGLLDTQVSTDKPLSISATINKLLKQALRLGGEAFEKKEPKYDLYLDLVGISTIDVLLKIRKQNLCRYYVGFNLGPWNLLLDYSTALNPVLFSKKHILDSYRFLLKGALGLDIDIPDSIDLGASLIKPVNFNSPAPYILVNISGEDRFRGPGLKSYAQILERLDFRGRIVVMDDPGQAGIKEFKGYIKKNICYLERDYSVWELAYIAKHSVMYIGSDSGITQLLSGMTHCSVFFATGSNFAWKPYSKGPYSRKTSGYMVIEESETSGGLIKKIIYTPAWCRPCFDIGCSGYRCMARLDTGFVAAELNQALKKIEALQ